MNVRSIGVWAAVAVIIIAVVALVVRMDKNRGGGSSSTAKSAEEILTLRSDDHVKGNPETATVTIIEYSDFQCPACASAYDYFKDIDTVFPEGVVFAYRHFPLTLIHRNADEAARATEAAALQGQFRAMHDMLFEKQKEWSERVDIEKVLTEYAEEIGLDKERFITDYKSDAVKNRVKSDAKDAQKLGLTGTPTIFVDGVKIQLPSSKEKLYEAIRERIQRAGDNENVTQE